MVTIVIVMMFIMMKVKIMRGLMLMVRVTLLGHLRQLQFSILVCVKDLQLEKMES